MPELSNSFYLGKIEGVENVSYKSEDLGQAIFFTELSAEVGEVVTISEAFYDSGLELVEVGEVLSFVKVKEVG